MNIKKKLKETIRKTIRNSDPSVKNFIKARVYKFRARNFSYGVYDGNGGFIGIREKFGNRYLFTEFHHTVSRTFGTVKDVTDTGIDVPAGIKIKESLGTIDTKTGRAVFFDDEIRKSGGWGWTFEDTGINDRNIQPIAKFNQPLFDFLEKTL